ncbi:hypothetical protein C0J52_24332, partial [Blattella germanica]
ADWNGFLTASATKAAFCSGVDTRLLPEPARRCSTPSLDNCTCELLIQGRRYSKQPGKSSKSNITLLNVDITSVTISPGDMETVSVCVINIPPEVPIEGIENVLKGYGKVLSVVNEKWATKYRYSVQ